MPVIIMVLLLQLCLLGRQNSQRGDSVSQLLEVAQVVQSLSSDLSEYHVLEVQEGARRIGDEEATVVGILLAHAAQQSRAIVGEFEGLVTEGRSEDRAVSLREVSELSVGPGHLSVEVRVEE